MKDEVYIARTLALAARAKGMTSPNPMVGALVVKEGRIIAEGYHKKAGTPHAEVIALERAGQASSGATLYVNLEPCCHRDKRTPPCSERIISSGVSKVVIAMADPNPKVSGRGIEALRDAGIFVSTGIMEDRAKRLNETYIKYITKKTPFVILKVAMTLDGKTATPEGESKWITGDKSRRLVHRYRGEVDAVLSAIGTVKADNPQFTCRAVKRKSPVRVIIDPKLEIRIDAKALITPPQTIVVTRKTGRADKKSTLVGKNITIIEYDDDRLDLHWLMSELGKRDVTSVMVEGGASLNSSCLESGIVDKVIFFIAPKIIGGKESFPAVGGNCFRKLSDALQVHDVSVQRIGPDIVVTGYLSS